MYRTWPEVWTRLRQERARRHGDARSACRSGRCCSAAATSLPFVLAPLALARRRAAGARPRARRRSRSSGPPARRWRSGCGSRRCRCCCTRSASRSCSRSSGRAVRARPPRPARGLARPRLRRVTRTHFPWHRVFHPLCGADPATLAALVLRRGPARRAPARPPSPSPPPRRSSACRSRRSSCCSTRSPAPDRRTAGLHCRATRAAARRICTTSWRPPAPSRPSRPVLAALPWERRTLGPLLRPFIDPYLPETRLIDGVALGPDAPTEDEVGLANLGAGFVFPRDLLPARLRRGLPRRADRRRRARRRTRRARSAAMSRAMARRGAPPLLLEEPGLYRAGRRRCSGSFPAPASSTSTATRTRSSPRPGGRCARRWPSCRSSPGRMSTSTPSSSTRIPR